MKRNMDMIEKTSRKKIKKSKSQLEHILDKQQMILKDRLGEVALCKEKNLTIVLC